MRYSEVNELIKKNPIVKWYFNYLCALQEELHNLRNPSGYPPGYKIKLREK